MKIDSDLIERILTLSRLSLTPDEKSEFIPQLSSIVSYVEKINELNTEDVPPADHIIDLHSIMRDDNPAPSLERKKIEAMAPEFAKGHIVVPRIIEEIE